MTKSDIAWAAGFWEGEGSGGIWRHRAKPTGKVYRYVYVTASQREPECLHRLKAMFGGNVSRLRKKSKQEIWAWRISGSGALAFIKAISPWLSERRLAQIEKWRAEL